MGDERKRATFEKNVIRSGSEIRAKWLSDNPAKLSSVFFLFFLLLPSPSHFFLLSSFFSIILIPLPILPYFLFPSLRASDDGRESSISSDVCVCRDYGEESYISVNFITRVADDLMFLLTYNLIVLLMT